jgi:hypothetical protein
LQKISKICRIGRWELDGRIVTKSPLCPSVDFQERSLQIAEPAPTIKTVFEKVNCLLTMTARGGCFTMAVMVRQVGVNFSRHQMIAD